MQTEIPITDEKSTANLNIYKNTKVRKTFIIGDVHGCIDELQELMQQLAPDAEDRLIFIGDLIDRGPDSLAVVKQVFQWSKSLEVMLTLGNHEEKFLRYLHHIQSKNGKEKEMKGVHEFPSLLNELTEPEINFLENAFHTIHLPEYDTLIVHAGVWKDIQFPLPASYPYRGEKSAAFKKIGLLNKTRYLNPQGKFVSMGEEKSEDVFWAENYEGQWGHIYFGHQNFINSLPVQFPHATALDTGCVYGGWLSAVEISADQIRYNSVAARKTYAVKKMNDGKYSK
jgi:hypothetical protein